jgi:hypothetical protein
MSRNLHRAILIVIVSIGFLGITDSAFASFFGYDTWYDAEKTPWPPPDDDDYMCWAGAASNILAWGGWGTSTFNNEDKIFQNFQDHWTDQGSLVDVGWRWWLNGEYPPGYPYSNKWSRVDVPGGGNHYPTYDFDSYYYENWNTAQSMSAIDEYLHNGYGSTIAIYTEGSGHALTVWGYEYSGSNDYLGLHVTDSDDYLSQLAYYPVSWDSGNNWWALGGGYSDWHIGGVEALTATPEPASAVLFLLGAATLAARSYRKRRKR